MNTVKKGDKLELQIYEFFKDAIDKDEFFFKKDSCKIYSQKGYYSKDREKDIKFDVSIEVFLPNQDTYSLLFLIECKNYNHRVPVDDVEELFAKVQQISGANTKAILASTNSFQEGALKFSKSKGIGLLRYYDSSNLNWELARSPSLLISRTHTINEWFLAKKGIIEQEHHSQYYDYYGYINDKYTNSLKDFFDNMLKESIDKKTIKELSRSKNIKKLKKLSVPYRDTFNIEEEAESLLKQINYQSQKVPLETISKWLKDEYELETIYKPLGSEILGKINFKSLKIYLNSNEADYPERVKFTFAHEIGHFLLGHGKYMSSESCSEENLDIDKPPKITIKDIMKMEFQANYFASSLLLPKEQFVQSFLSVAKEYGVSNRGHGFIYLDSQPCNLDTYYKVTTKLMNKYSVSRTVVKIRLKYLGILCESKNS